MLFAFVRKLLTRKLREKLGRGKSAGIEVFDVWQGFTGS
jgi:hypothetical protein